MATGRINVAPMAPFDPMSDPNSLSQRWKTGQETQDIFDTLVDIGEDDDYDSAIAALDTYFHLKNMSILKFLSFVKPNNNHMKQSISFQLVLGSWRQPVTSKISTRKTM
ncbi:Hypothetical predicted protein, partial [Paramuricea clavata]